jgi:hypothetical protein
MMQIIEKEGKSIKLLNYENIRWVTILGGISNFELRKEEDYE